MTKKILVTLTSAAVIAIALAFVGPEGAKAACEGRHCQDQQRASKRSRRPAASKRARAGRHRVKGGRKSGHEAVTYSCPMHPDIREKAAGTCPKCLMNLERETAKAQQ